MKNIIFFILALGLISCAKSDDWPPPTIFSAVLMNSDSTSVLTSEMDKIIISYKEGEMMRQLYDVSVSDRGKYCTFSSISLFGIKNNPLYIDCKGKVDTLIVTQSPAYEDDSFEGYFNGQRIYIGGYRGIIYLVR